MEHFECCAGETLPKCLCGQNTNHVNIFFKLQPLEAGAEARIILQFFDEDILLKVTLFSSPIFSHLSQLR